MTFLFQLLYSVQERKNNLNLLNNCLGHRFYFKAQMLEGSIETELSTLKFYALRVLGNYTVELTLIFFLHWDFPRFFLQNVLIDSPLPPFDQWRMGLKYKKQAKAKSNSLHSMNSVSTIFTQGGSRILFCFQLAFFLFLLSLKCHQGTPKLVQMQICFVEFPAKGNSWNPFLLHVHGSFLIAESACLAFLNQVKQLETSTVVMF